MHPQRRIRESSTRTLARPHAHKRATRHACLRYAPAGSTRLTAPHARLNRSLANARSLAGSRPHPAMAWPAAANAPGLGPLGRWGGALPRPFGQGPLPPPPGLPARLLSSLGPPRPAAPLSPLRGVPSGAPRPVPGAPSGARCCAPAAGGVGPGRRGPGGCAPAPRRPLHGSCPPRPGCQGGRQKKGQIKKLKGWRQQRLNKNFFGRQFKFMLCSRFFAVFLNKKSRFFQRCALVPPSPARPAHRPPAPLGRPGAARRGLFVPPGVFYRLRCPAPSKQLPTTYGRYAPQVPPGWAPAQFATPPARAGLSLAPARPPSLLWLRSAPSGYNQALGGGLCPRPRCARGSLRYAQAKPSPPRWAARGWFLFRLSPRCRSISSSLGRVFPRCRAFNYLGAALPLALRAIATLRESAGAPFPRLSFRAGPQFPALFPPLATLAPYGLRGERSRRKRRVVFFGYARPRQLRPACDAGKRSGGVGVSLMCPSGKRAGRRPDAGAKRGAPLHAGLFWQTCGARGPGDARGAGLASPRRAGWGRAKPAVARFLRASLIQPAQRGAGSPYKAPRATPCPLIAPRRSASPVFRSAPRFFLPPRQGDAPNRPPARWARDTPTPPLRCVALRAPRPQFPWPATRCPPLSSPPLFKLRRRRCGGPPLVEQFETFGWRQQRRKPTRGREKMVAGCARHLDNTNAAKFFFQLNISKAKVGHFGRTCQGSKCQKLPNSLRRKRLRRFTNFYHFSTLTEPPKIPSEAFENFEF